MNYWIQASKSDTQRKDSNLSLAELLAARNLCREAKKTLKRVGNAAKSFAFTTC